MVRELNIGGTERQCAEMARALDRRRFLAHVGCFHKQGFRADELTRDGIPILHLPVTSFGSTSAIKGLLMLRAYIRRHNIQVVHTFDFPMNLYAAAAARLFRVPVVLTSQRQSHDLLPSVNPWLWITDRLANGIVVNSDAVRREILTRNRVPAAQVHLCYNGIDTARFQPRPLDPDPPELTIGVLCALRPEKSLLTLVDAFERVRHLRNGLRLLIVGSGVMQDPILQRVREYNLEARFHHELATSDVPAWMRRMDIFVLPSISEAFSNSLMEAMASGCCPVASRVGGNPELVEDNRTGRLFEAGNAEDLAAQLRDLILDSGLRLKLAREAAAFLHSRFSLQASAGALGDLYERLLASR